MNFAILGSPVILFSIAFFVLGLAKLGKLSVANAGAVCLVAGGVLPTLFGLFYYVQGFNLALADHPAATAVLKVGTIFLIFASVFLVLSFTLLKSFGGTLEPPSTGFYAAAIGVLGTVFGYTVFMKFPIPGMSVMLFGVTAIILGTAVKTGKGLPAAASFTVLSALVNLTLGFAFQLKYLP
ncbi:MAG: hypothetical protein QME41_09870 [Actinomycetota bacterium]|nr:hypothetical protein [Actinomycetota bacterium]